MLISPVNSGAILKAISNKWRNLSENLEDLFDAGIPTALLPTSACA